MLLIDLLAILLILGVAGYYLYRRSVGESKQTLAQRRAAAIEDAEADRLLAKAVRLLDAGLLDPVYRQSESWNEIARDIVDDYNN